MNKIMNKIKNFIISVFLLLFINTYSTETSTSKADNFKIFFLKESQQHFKLNLGKSGELGNAETVSYYSQGIISDSSTFDNGTLVALIAFRIKTQEIYFTELRKIINGVMVKEQNQFLPNADAQQIFEVLSEALSAAK